MAGLVNATQLTLLVLSGLGFYFTWYSVYNNGTVDRMSDIRDNRPRILQGTNEPIKTYYTGITAIDDQLGVLDVFFWEMVDGSFPAGSLFCFHFAGQVLAGWPLLMIESMRNGNKWRVISFISVWGLLVQNLAYAVVMPIWFILHLSTSPTVTSNSTPDFLVDFSSVAGIPLSMAVGYVLPTVLMSLPAPSVQAFEQKQMFMALWQEFPLWVGIAQQLLQPILASVFGLSGHKAESREISKEKSIEALRILYVALLAAAGANQVSTMTLVGTSTMFPGLFAAEHQNPFDARKVFLPQATSAFTKVESIGSGVLMLLQYDNFIGCSSMALWASTLFLQARKSGKGSSNFVTICILGLATVAVTGPLGYAVACIWARDEIVLAKEVEGEKKIR